MNLSGWGRYPVADCNFVEPRWAELCGDRLANRPLIARGNGRAYGDSALNRNCTLITKNLDHILAFDPDSGEVICESGVLLSDLLRIFVPKGFFPPVTPGTKFVTVGGMVASDVHGKNHHRDGCFSNYITFLKLLLADGSTIQCSPSCHTEIYRATCGGMGLTGVILQVGFKLRPIRSAQITETTIKAPNLEATLELFEMHGDSPYSVAWIDCQAKGGRLGRSHVILGDHVDEGALDSGKSKPAMKVPFAIPSLFFNHFTITAFNTLYYYRVVGPKRERSVHYDNFFYPLDGLAEWNRLYGRSGFVQYQFVIPQLAAREGIARVLTRVADSGRGSFLAVLKSFGPANDNLLSFPMEGITLALDFRMDRDLEQLIEELDQVVLDYGGRVYLTKDSLMREATFKASYPCWGEFVELRRALGADKVFQSMQSQRLGL